MGFESLKDILRRARERHPGFAKRLREAEAVARWEQSVGAHIARHTRVICVKEGVLWLEVDHPIWKSELHHRKRQILEKLNAYRPPVTSPVASNGKQAGAAGPPPIQDLLLLDPRPDQPESRKAFSRKGGFGARAATKRTFFPRGR